MRVIVESDDVAAVMAARAEDAAWAAALPDRRATIFPHEVISAELDGTHPLRAWRNYRGLTQRSLAEVMRDLIAQVETGKRQGSVETLSRLAAALGVPMDALVAP